MRADIMRRSIRQPMKGFNFRFSEGEIEVLDMIVNHYEANADHFMFWRPVTRTDVIKKLMHDEKNRIEEQANAKIAEALEAVEKAKPKKKAKKKAVSA
jgi:hypothetical protein